MKISPATLVLLKNFNSINKSMYFKQGNTIRTIIRAVLAEAVVAEEFPTDFAIFDLGNLLNVISLFKDPEFEFGEDALRIVESNGKAETRYAYAGDGLVSNKIPEGKLEPPDDVIEFKLEEETWTTLQRATSVFNKPEVKIISDGTTVRMATERHTDAHGNEYSTILEAEPNGIVCKQVLSMDHMKLIKGAYTGLVTPSYVRFTHTSGYDLTYYVGVEPNSSSFGSEQEMEMSAD